MPDIAVSGGKIATYAAVLDAATIKFATDLDAAARTFIPSRHVERYLGIGRKQATSQGEIGAAFAESKECCAITRLCVLHAV